MTHKKITDTNEMVCTKTCPSLHFFTALNCIFVSTNVSLCPLFSALNCIYILRHLINCIFILTFFLRGYLF